MVGRLPAVWRHALGPFLALSVVVPCATASPDSLDPETAPLMERAFQGLGTAPIVDVHVHLVALNAGGAYVNPGKQSPARPLEWLKTRLYLRASGVKDLARFDEAYVERLVNGSDYPLPGIPLLTFLRQFAYHGFVTESEARALANVFKSNPLLADFLLKRTIRDPASGRGLDPRIFTGAPLVGGPSASP